MAAVPRLITFGQACVQPFNYVRRVRIHRMPEPPKPDASKVVSADDRVGLDRIEFDEEPFITVDTEICRRCEGKPCLYVCPTQVYRLDKGELVYNTEGCIELGACTIVCDHIGKGAIRWSYPSGSAGVQFRFG